MATNTDSKSSDIRTEQTGRIRTSSSKSETSQLDGATLGHEVIDDDGYIHHTMTLRLFLALLSMSFLWVGSQIPLYLYGSVLPLIYEDIGGYDRYVWFVIAYLIPNAALCPFVGALSDMFGRKRVALVGQICLIVGPIITATAHTMNIAICGQVFSGLGAGLNELIALSGAAEMVPIAKRGNYVAGIVFTILPFCPSTLWAQLISAAANWRWNAALVCGWNFIGLVLVLVFYKDPPRPADFETKREILRKIDYIGGILSVGGCILFMMGMQWGAVQYKWNSVHVLVPFILGIVLIITFFIYEIRFARYPMVPRRIFSLDKRTMVIILIITFVSGGNYFVLLMMWPSQVYDVYGPGAVVIGLRTLPMGLGIVGGSFIALVILSHVNGRIKEVMIFFCVLMTAFCGAMSIAGPDNLNTIYAIVLFGAIGVGGVIIPSSIIAQIVCPPDLIGTITAITLAIRYIGGAIAFTAYYNAVDHKFRAYSPDIVIIDTIYDQGIVSIASGEAGEQAAIELLTLAAIFDLKGLAAYIDSSPLIARKDIAYAAVVKASQLAYAKAYRWPYYISIAFGGVTCILALFLGNIKRFMTMQVTATDQAQSRLQADGNVNAIKEESSPQVDFGEK